MPATAHTTPSTTAFVSKITFVCQWTIVPTMTVTFPITYFICQCFPVGNQPGWQPSTPLHPAVLGDQPGAHPSLHTSSPSSPWWSTWCSPLPPHLFTQQCLVINLVLTPSSTPLHPAVLGDQPGARPSLHTSSPSSTWWSTWCSPLPPHLFTQQYLVINLALTPSSTPLHPAVLGDQPGAHPSLHTSPPSSTWWSTWRSPLPPHLFTQQYLVINLVLAPPHLFTQGSSVITLMVTPSHSESLTRDLCPVFQLFPTPLLEQQWEFSSSSPVINI